MCCAFLEGIFDVVYNDIYLGEENRAKTVMYAYDDAIHGKMGKAKEDKIFPVVHSEEKLTKLLMGQKEVEIYANGLDGQAEAFAKKVRDFGENPIECSILELPTDATLYPARLHLYPHSVSSQYKKFSSGKGPILRITDALTNTEQAATASEYTTSGGGFNVGIRYALEEGYEYVWCLDNDVLVDENAVGPSPFPPPPR